MRWELVRAHCVPLAAAILVTIAGVCELVGILTVAYLVGRWSA